MSVFRCLFRSTLTTHVCETQRSLRSCRCRDWQPAEVDIFRCHIKKRNLVFQVNIEKNGDTGEMVRRTTQSHYSKSVRMFTPGFNAVSPFDYRSRMPSTTISVRSWLVHSTLVRAGNESQLTLVVLCSNCPNRERSTSLVTCDTPKL